MRTIKEILKASALTKADIMSILSAVAPDEVEKIRLAAERVLLENCSANVYFRGLIEFSNICNLDCHYCGIRKNNRHIDRYQLTRKEIIDAATWCAENGYGSIVLQSGERRDEAFVDFLVDVVATIKQKTTSGTLPQGIGITLSVGEQAAETYARFFQAGAHRYLLRLETSNPRLFASLHPPGQRFETRLHCLKILQEIGFQVGTGVMIGLPGQTIEMLADDILFFRRGDFDMIGMGPYLVHNDTPMVVYRNEIAARQTDIFRISLLMIAAARLLLRDVNIAATTALQAIADDGREQGLRFGANVIMPQVTPTEYRRNYLLYEGKPCLDEQRDQSKEHLASRISLTGRQIAWNKWGDPRHFASRLRPAARLV